MNEISEEFLLRAKGYEIIDSRQRISCAEELSKDEEKFLWLVKDGDSEGIQLLLQIDKELNVDCCDYRGQRALEIAIGNGDPEFVEFLLGELNVSIVHYYGAVLKAVIENEVCILQMLLERAKDNQVLHKKLQDLIGGAGTECLKYLPEVASTNMTPIMVAAVKGNFEITRMLLERKYAIQKPHGPKCNCLEQCFAKRAQAGETLTDSMNRMKAYRALASSTYLILNSEDPILSAFQLARETEYLSLELPENQKEYLDLSSQCAKFAVDILHQCRNTEEVQTVLVQRKGFNDPRPHRFSRLHLAIQYGQKEFVAHPSCQQVLRSMWVEGLGSWYTWSVKWRAFHVIKQVFLMPFICTAFIFIPRAEVIGPLCVPLNRFIYSATSYIIFLSLLMVTLLNDRRYDLDSPATWTEVAVGFFVVSSSWAIASNLFSIGISNYFQSGWSVFDLIMYLLFLIAEVLWFSVFLFRSVSEPEGPWNRMNWPWYHPILLGEGIYSAASVMAFSRLLLWCHINSRVGPLGICLKRMIRDVFRFFMVFFIIMFAFATGLNSIYKSYKGSERTETDELVSQPEAFLTLKSTFKSLFWAIFGMGEPDYADIVVSGNVTLNETAEELIQIQHVFTEGVGYGLWGLYHLVTVVVLLNMLIAMMAESYQRVQQNSDLEWKYACSTLWLTVFDSHAIVPPPFNLIPSMHKMVLLCQMLIAKLWGKTDENGDRISWSFRQCCYRDTEPDISKKNNDEDKYEKLLIQLIRRYLHNNDLRESASTASCLPTEVKDRLKSDIIQDLRQSLKRSNRKFSMRDVHLLSTRTKTQ